MRSARSNTPTSQRTDRSKRRRADRTTSQKDTTTKKSSSTKSTPKGSTSKIESHVRTSRSKTVTPVKPISTSVRRTIITRPSRPSTRGIHADSRSSPVKNQNSTPVNTEKLNLVASRSSVRQQLRKASTVNKSGDNTSQVNSKPAARNSRALKRERGDSAIRVTRKKMNVEGMQQIIPDLDPPQEMVEVSSSNGGLPPAAGSSSPTSPKKLKGSLSIKFKSYNWTKDAQKPKQTLDLRDTFGSSEDEAEEKLATSVAAVSENIAKVVVAQNNQTLQKCHECLLYIPTAHFDQHASNDCEALHVGGDREYICSECLACYSSQKFLVRHKRECPKRNQNYTINRGYPKGSSQTDLDNMYSVVWKCHCKKNFTSAEDLGKHRETCISAQQYTATCPICNSRMMGGSRTLRYHMTQHHADLFMPDETNSSSMLSSLQGKSPVQVITTQSSNIDDLVKRLSMEHSGANIRVVSVSAEEQKKQQLQRQQQRRRQSEPDNVEVEYADKQAAHDEDRQAAEAMLHMECEVVHDNPDMRKRRSTRTTQEQSEEDEAVDAEPTAKRTRIRISPRAKTSVSEAETQKPVETKHIATRSKQSEPQAAANGKAQREVKQPESKVNTRGKAKVVKDDEDAETDKQVKGKDDLQNLLVKAKALTRELEVKLAQNSSQDTPTRISRQRNASTDSESESALPNVEDDTPEKPVPVKQEVMSPPAKPPVQRAKKQHAKVTCLDCKQIFKDFIELGRHKRTDCPVVISQHLSADGNFTEKVFRDEPKGKQQKLDVVECYYCTLCEAKFKLRSQVYEHMRFEHKNKGLGHYLNYHCPYCPRVFQTTRQRHAHKLERHSDIRIAPDDDFTIKETDVCTVCYQVVPKWDKDKHDATDCKRHVMELECETFCQLCGVLCETQEQLKHHRQVEHLNAIHFRCGQCTRTFGHAVELRCHKVSHHSKTPRWEQNYSTIVQQESTKGSKNVKIHISPAVEEVRKPTMPRTKVGTPTKLTGLQSSASTPGTSEMVVTPTPAVIPKAEFTPKEPSTPKSVAIRLPAAGGKLNLTPDQMKNLAKGQPIKLVVPKDADMKNISFTVPGEDGKFKKYSLTTKPATPKQESSDKEKSVEGGDKDSEVIGTVSGSEGELAGSPQKDLVAALGLQPKDMHKPTAPHRPKRLRSGRTIDSTEEDVSVKKEDTKQKPAVSKASDTKPATRGTKVAKQTDGDDSKEDTVDESPQKTRTSARREAMMDKAAANKAAEEKKETVDSKKARPSTRTKEIFQENDEDEPKDGKATRTSSRKSEDEGKLAPVQVLKPIGKDKVQCMRCQSTLHSMMEVANHQCSGNN